MKQPTHFRSLILAAALALGGSTFASAQSTDTAAPAATPPAPAGGLLGSRYTELGYNYTDLTGPGPRDANGLMAFFNQPLHSNLDLNFGYDWARSSYTGIRNTRQDAEVGATAYAPLAWGKPFVLAAAGWEWTKVAGLAEDSFRYKVGIGAELPVAAAFTVTPYVNFVRATRFNESEGDFGVKAAYRIARDWSLTARAQYDAIRHAKDAAEYSLGVAYHF